MEVVTFGESMVVFNPDVAGPLRSINTFTKSLGGAESNFAIALSRLGHKVGWFSRVGNDEFGKYIINTIRGEGVDVSKAIVDNERSTGILFKEKYQSVNPNVYYYRKGSAASTLNSYDIDENYIKQAKILHITGITPALSKSAEETVFRAVDIAKSNGVLVSFDPNIRLKLWNISDARSILLKLANISDIIMPGLDEAEVLTGLKDPEKMAEYFLSMNNKLVAIKLGEDGCYLCTKEKRIYSKGFKVQNLVDTVGAGDGFAAGLISGFLRGLSLEECGLYANGVGAMATFVKGDMEGYPEYEKLINFIGKDKHIER